jgi:sulfur-oxidizing protein SoxY
MQRRKFLGLGVLALSAAIPATLSALDYRKEKPDTWTAKTQDDAIKKLFGDIKPTEGGIDLKVPKIANNGGSIPVGIKTDLPAKTVAVFQNVNPESTVAVYDIPENAVVDYLLKIKMKKSGAITVIVETKDGKFHKVSKSLEVALGGCEG